MKLAHPMLNHPIEWENVYINTFVIENPFMYRNFLREIIEQEQGLHGAFVLSHGLDILDISKNIEIVSDVLKIDTGSNKKIITGIIKELTNIAINEKQSQTYELYRKINEFIADTIFTLDNELVFDDINDISQIFKIYNVRPEEENLTLAKKILLHMDLCEKYIGKKLFVFFNLHSYFTQAELESLFKNFIYRKYNVFIVERYDHKSVQFEQKRIIDIDLCEI
ncbi:MAG: type II-A CRISPR-associated protein Csn2 [Clostridia bacterium]|nr:type II-A CRISPR-associated protein Csn2 [Clostridia bacterium]